MTSRLAKYYESIQPYVPPSAQAILAREMVEIERSVEESCAAFGEQLGAYITEQTDAYLKQVQQEVGVAKKRIDAALKALSAKQPELAAVDTLKAALDDYQASYERIGEGLGSIACTALKAAGLPL